MPSTYLQDQVIDVICKALKCSSDRVTAETSLAADLGLDSLTVAELLLDVEEQFGFVIPDADAMLFRTVGDVTDYIALRR